MDLYGLLNACDALFASFPRTLEKGPREGQLIPQEIGTVWSGSGWSMMNRWNNSLMMFEVCGPDGWTVWEVLCVFETCCSLEPTSCVVWLSLAVSHFPSDLIHFLSCSFIFLDISHESISDCRATGPAMEGALAEQQEHSGLREYGWSYSGLL